MNQGRFTQLALFYLLRITPLHFVNSDSCVVMTLFGLSVCGVFRKWTSLVSRPLRSSPNILQISKLSSNKIM
ncbi:uncharacterized protein EV420DRAFT_1551981 [Desarmillaria tabescens]|uniref:Uncharacterized protein n=1 Tax=Armillaria tabescens TaxID=1929756 RepID=A0AA39K9W7_ARMTA|nr:uncharacterized protein EV420DRAFT_1551981 [Desarmillaria tabescens]KAK0457180.1 hypothetical protein EV420DRAFT_1551981 [Desarmillaria tabescens]